LLLRGQAFSGSVVQAATVRELTGLRGTHARIAEQSLRVPYTEFMRRLRQHEALVVPQFERMQQLKKELIDRARKRLQLESFKPRVLTSFVRNRLIDTVYLPLVGDNLAKQMGAAGDAKRTDRMGLLLLVSPPGYGKTTLLEYVASRLGIVFMKVNGPRSVTA
jgi:SpoVK/Ycf46/Vps4 family AAA+-type ATPase